MTIAETREKCKSLVARVPRDILILGILVLTSTLSFGFGYFAGLDAEQGSKISPTEQAPTSVPTSRVGTPAASVGEVGAPTDSVGVVASKNGTKYYLPSCSGANRISPANKVWFVSVAAAMSAGYTPAANCPGL